MSKARLLLTEITLFIAWLICPKEERYHILSAANEVRASLYPADSKNDDKQEKAG